MKNKGNIAESLLKIKAVTLSLNPPYTWVSGIKSPIYCDNRMLISYPEHRNKVIDGFLTIIEQEKFKPDVIAGTATSGIPFAAWLADKMNLPMVYVRAEKKAHGRGKAIEGYLEKGANVLVVEDLISTGKSSVAVVNNLKEEGANVLAVVSIFSYEMAKAKQTFKEANTKAIPLETISSLLEYAVSSNYLSKEDATIINDFRNDPAGWFERNFK
jgi:orotate phosphoribosyltransferase